MLSSAAIAFIVVAAIILVVAAARGAPRAPASAQSGESFAAGPTAASGPSCRRSAGLDYAVGATARGGAAGRKEAFEPVPDLGRRACGPAADLEDRLDGTLRDAQPPQPLPYSTIANDPPALGVQNPVEAEPDNTVTHLFGQARMHRWADPYLTDAAKFGRSPVDTPPGAPGSMAPDTGFLESFAAAPLPLITAVTGRSAARPAWGAAARSRDITRHSDSSWAPEGPAEPVGSVTEARFGRAPFHSPRPRAAPRWGARRGP